MGTFRFTDRGLELTRVVPGVDVQRDILDGCGAEIVLPEGRDVVVVDRSVLTGEGYRLRRAAGPADVSR